MCIKKHCILPLLCVVNLLFTSLYYNMLCGTREEKGRTGDKGRKSKTRDEKAGREMKDEGRKKYDVRRGAKDGKDGGITSFFVLRSCLFVFRLSSLVLFFVPRPPSYVPSLYSYLVLPCIRSGF